MLRFEWDPDKDSLNKQRHHVGFAEAKELWEGTHVVIPAKNVLGEDRFAILGRIKQKLYIAIFTERGDVLRLISCHRAEGRLEQRYEDFISEKIKKG